MGVVGATAGTPISSRNMSPSPLALNVPTPPVFPCEPRHQNQTDLHLPAVIGCFNTQLPRSPDTWRREHSSL
ncbi:uncharacterized protein K452DRAFT_289886 [Aplosporella prunicola CBS 121167]|uniref:Uncharacterized protein n=1 Tax=Aplosporella prunicola CBS 121167 TaxID=1176127 RepID=A0A6A6B643_9PEZI|nr:uncharacterized protein K452DRAFT_289886 [Aplosporella prunicola CBS 121167]KAF2139336.1 hypothetical protein K452DRAFT_289886 [Aplosporella prunicola CBS 121167]